MTNSHSSSGSASGRAENPSGLPLDSLWTETDLAKKVRKTPDGRIAGPDLLAALLGQQRQNGTPWRRLCEQYPEISTGCANYRFPGTRDVGPPYKRTGSEVTPGKKNVEGGGRSRAPGQKPIFRRSLQASFGQDSPLQLAGVARNLDVAPGGMGVTDF